MGASFLHGNSCCGSQDLQCPPDHSSHYPSSRSSSDQCYRCWQDRHKRRGVAFAEVLTVLLHQRLGTQVGAQNLAESGGPMIHRLNLQGQPRACMCAWQREGSVCPTTSLKTACFCHRSACLLPRRLCPLPSPQTRTAPLQASPCLPCKDLPATCVCGTVQALTYDVRKSRQREVVAFMQTGSAIRIQACVRGWLARRHFSARLAAALLLARCGPRIWGLGFRVEGVLAGRVSMAHQLDGGWHERGCWACCAGGERSGMHCRERLGLLIDAEVLQHHGWLQCWSDSCCMNLPVIPQCWSDSCCMNMPVVLPIV